MKERPILFSAPMIRALLAGTKTQTRRAIKTHRSDDSFALVRHSARWWPYRSEDGESEVMSDGCEYPYNCPYGVTGDTLWCRETWRYTADSLEESRAITEDITSGSAVDWRATYVDDCMKELGFSYEEALVAETFETWRPSIFMPRWASRITLEITDVRVERLQDISGSDCLAEGVKQETRIDDGVPKHGDIWKQAKVRYRELWESINGAGSWDINPWVWAITFKRLP